MSQTSKQYCTFFVNGQFFGVEVLNVQEVLRYQQMTSVPLAPPTVQGLINLRGQIVTAIDLRRRLDLPARPDHELPEHPPETLRGVARELIKGVYKLKDRLLLVLDTERTVNLSGGTALGNEQNN
jgi:purine-binding chemotaxis protein CheW